MNKIDNDSLLNEWLYKKNSKGNVFAWRVVLGEDNYYTQHYRETENDPNIVTDLPITCYPKNVGKKNETSAKDQACLEAMALIKKKLKEGYGKDKEQLKEGGNNNFFTPMLAKQYKDYQKKIKFPVAVQPKLNGIRCLITWDAEKEKVVAFSRKGEPFFCIPHILEELKEVCIRYSDYVLDGELFNYEMKNNLNEIARLVSVNKKDPSSEDLDKSKEIVQYHIYDIFEKDKVKTEPLSFIGRNTIRIFFFKDFLSESLYVKNVLHTIAKNDDEVQALANSAFERKEEGIIIRAVDSFYQNCRTKDLLKLKSSEDEEFQVVDIKEGTGNWIGCAKIIVCELKEPNKQTGEKTFESNIEGDRETLRDLYSNRSLYIGKMATVRFQEYSPYGVPLIPYTGLPFRDYE